MSDVDVRTQDGGTAGSIELPDEIFGVEPNIGVMHQVVVAQLAAARSGTHSTKTRAEVAGGGAKPYRQKGTGRARQGSIRAPQFTGGGVAHGPKPRDHSKKVNKKVTRLALKGALSDRAVGGRVVVVDRWSFDAPSTRAARRFIETLGLGGRVLVVLGPDDDVVGRSFRNLPQVQLLDSTQLNTYDVLRNDWVVFTRDSLPLAEPTTDPEATPPPAEGLDVPAAVGSAAQRAEVDPVEAPLADAAPVVDLGPDAAVAETDEPVAADADPIVDEERPS